MPPPVEVRTNPLFEGLKRLVGVLPMRRFLTEMPDRILSDAMIKSVVTRPSSATVFDMSATIFSNGFTRGRPHHPRHR
jgi:hypothetical protein